jgi:hypothetical protein
MSLLSFVQWLEQSPVSVAMHESIYAFPVVESVHVLGLCLFLGLAVLWDLRLLGVTLRSVPASEVSDRLLPWMWAGAVIMVVSGGLVFLNTPVRYYTNIFFRVKVVMLLLAVMNAWVFHTGIYRRIAEWEREGRPPHLARLPAGLSCLPCPPRLLSGLRTTPGIDLLSLLGRSREDRCRWRLPSDAPTCFAAVSVCDCR